MSLNLESIYNQLWTRVVNLWTVIGNIKLLSDLTPIIRDVKKKEIVLSKVLKKELKGRVLSKVAREIGISVAILHDWHSSSRKPSAKNLFQLKKLAEYLGLTLEEILFDEKTDKKTICSTTFNDEGKTYRINIERLE